MSMATTFRCRNGSFWALATFGVELRPPTTYGSESDPPNETVLSPNQARKEYRNHDIAFRFKNQMMHAVSPAESSILSQSSPCAKHVEMSAWNGTASDIHQYEFDSLQIESVSSEETVKLSEAVSNLNGSKNPRELKKDELVRILIGLEPPNRFRTTSESFLTYFRFKSQDLCHSSLRVLYGPETDQRAIRSLVAGRCESSRVPLVLYRKDGEPVRCAAWTIPTVEENACALAFDVEESPQFPPPISPKHIAAMGTGALIENSQRKPVAATGTAAPAPAPAPAGASLLPAEAAFRRAVAIHIRAVRRAAGAGAAAIAAHRDRAGGAGAGAK